LSIADCRLPIRRDAIIKLACKSIAEAIYAARQRNDAQTFTTPRLESGGAAIDNRQSTIVNALTPRGSFVIVS
jgi:hypothetical protein